MHVPDKKSSGKEASSASRDKDNLLLINNLQNNTHLSPKFSYFIFGVLQLEDGG